MVWGKAHIHGIGDQSPRSESVKWFDAYECMYVVKRHGFASILDQCAYRTAICMHKHTPAKEREE